MRKSMLSLLVIFLACFGLIGAQALTGPKIAVKETRHDAGKVMQGTRVSYVFEIRNAGTETLVIERVQST